MEAPSTPFSPVAAQHPCINHAGVQTERRCGQCGQPFCEDCLVDIQGRPICGTCKALVLRDMQRGGKQRNKLAHDAFICSLVGMAVFGLVLEPLALIKGIQALRQFKHDPTLPERWKAVTAVVISSFLIGVFVLSMLVIVLTSGR